MGQIWEKHIHDKLVELDKVILPKYREESKKRIEEQKIDYSLYEKEFELVNKKSNQSINSDNKWGNKNFSFP